MTELTGFIINAVFVWLVVGMIGAVLTYLAVIMAGELKTMRLKDYFDVFIWWPINGGVYYTYGAIKMFYMGDNRK